MLAALLARPGKVVTREDLRAELWSDDTHVEFDRSLNTAVNKIREAVGDSAARPKLIETLPRRGYRFLGSVHGPAESDTSHEPTAKKVTADPAVLARTQRRLKLALVACTALGLTLAVLFVAGLSLRTEMAEPVKFVLAPGADVHDAVISPDGRYVAFVTFEDNGALWIQDLGKPEPRMIPGTEGARKPFWSPDSRSVGFGVGDSLWRARIEEPFQPFEICKVAVGGYRGGAWSPDGEEIVFTGPHLVPASGGVPVHIEPDVQGAGYDMSFEFLPLKERRVLLMHLMTPTGNEVRILDLDRSEEYRLIPGRSPVYSPAGHLIYQDSGPISRIWAQPFSLDTLQTTGDKFLVVDGGFAPSVSADGTLVYVDGEAGSVEHLVWRDRSGGSRKVVSPPLSEARHIDLSLAGDAVILSAVTDGRRYTYIVDVEEPLREPRPNHPPRPDHTGNQS